MPFISCREATSGALITAALGALSAEEQAELDRLCKKLGKAVAAMPSNSASMSASDVTLTPHLPVSPSDSG